jgi:small ubiquitin-related modifier
MTDNDEAKGSTAGKDDKDYIKLKVSSQDATEIHFRVKMTTQMSKLMKSYADRTGTDLHSLKFLTPEGERIKEADTPKSLNLENDDTIEVNQAQTGGIVLS